MEAIVERDNLRKALAQVKRNKGAAGVDGMSLGALAPYLKEHWPTIRAQLLDGTYKPQPVRRVEIPKASGGQRPLGIPTVLDRFIQQAMLQVLQADWDRTFSEHSYGFRPKRSAHQAVTRAQEMIAASHDVVVDIDLEKFFDRVNHDILMGLVAKRVADKRILTLIRGFLTFRDGGHASRPTSFRPAPSCGASPADRQGTGSSPETWTERCYAWGRSPPPLLPLVTLLGAQFWRVRLGARRYIRTSPWRLRLRALTS